MKINELNNPKKIDEMSSLAGALFGEVPMASLKGLLTGKGGKHQLSQDIFLRDFYQDALTSLDNGIKSGFIDPNLTSDLSANTPPGADSKQVDPAATPKPGAPAASGAPGAAAATANKAQQQTNQSLNNYVKQAAQTINSTTDKNQKIALTKELVNAMADRKGYPEWENALATVQQVIKRGNVDPNFATTAINNLKAGTTMTEAYNIYYINKLVESVGLTWNDLGLCVIKKNNNLYLAEQKYVKMNSLFESIMNITENQSTTVGEYMKDWFTKYMSGVAWEPKKSMVMPYIQQVETTYGSDKGKAAIKNLAKLAYSLSKAYGDVPAGAENAAQAAPAAANQSGKVDKDQLVAQLASLPDNERKEIINKAQAAPK